MDSSTMLNKPIKNNNIATNKDALMCVGSCEKYQGPLSEERICYNLGENTFLSIKCSSVEGGFYSTSKQTITF